MRYDYSCSECGCIQEESHSIKEDPAITCRSCGHSPMTRNICTTPQIVFRGEGWATKRGRVAKQMQESQARAEKAQVLNWGHLKKSKCVPNFDGEVTGDPGDPQAWRDAGKLAKENGVDASQFEAKAAECEQSTVVPDHLKAVRSFGESLSKTPSEPARTESMPVPGGMTQTSPSA